MSYKKKQDSEFERLSEIYNFSNPNLLCIGIGSEKARAILVSLKQFSGQYQLPTNTNGPDLVAKHNDAPIAIEHFQYDASRVTRDGSKETKELNMAENAFREEVKQVMTNGSTKSFFKKHEIQARADRESFTGNFLKGLEKHRGKIDDYKKNVAYVYSNNQTECWLLAEDCCSIPPFFPFRDKNSQLHYPAVLPPMYPEVAERLASTEIDGIIIVSNYPVSNFFTFIKNNRKYYKALANYYNFTEDTPVEFSNGSFAAFSIIPIVESNFD